MPARSTPPGVRLAVATLVAAACWPAVGRAGPWTWHEADRILEIGHGEGAEAFQCAAVHLDSGYLRLIPTADSGWGTSVVVMPAFWEGGEYHQGAPVHAEGMDVDVAEGRLTLRLRGRIGGLEVRLGVTLRDPAGGAIRAEVEARTEGTVQLDDRPREAFKPVMLSSMRISGTQWDAQGVVTDDAEHAIPAEGWMLAGPIEARTFGLRGGDSEWKPRAPTVLIEWPEPVAVAGWVTRSEDPNDDNLGLWAATDEVLTEWTYTVVSRVAEAAE